MAGAVCKRACVTTGQARFMGRVTAMPNARTLVMELSLNILRLNGEKCSVAVHPFAGALGCVRLEEQQFGNREERGTIPQGISKGCAAIAKFVQRPEAARKGRRRNCIGAFHYSFVLGFAYLMRNAES